MINERFNGGFKMPLERETLYLKKFWKYVVEQSIDVNGYTVERLKNLDAFPLYRYEVRMTGNSNTYYFSSFTNSFESAYLTYYEFIEETEVLQIIQRKELEEIF